MKVLWITPDFPSKSYPLAGIFQQTLAKALSEIGTVPDIIAPTPYVPIFFRYFKRRYRIIEQLPMQENDGPIVVRRPRYLTTPYEYVWRFSHLTQTRSIIHHDIARPSLIHAHFAYPVGAAALKLKSKWGCPLVLTLHGDDVTVHPYVSRWHKIQFARTVRQADYVIAVSDALADETEKNTGRRPTVLSVGIDPMLFQNLPERSLERKRLGLTDNAFVVLYVGNLLVQKGVVDLAKAFKAFGVQGSRLLFVGDGPCKPKGEGIVFCGNKPNRDIPRFLAISDLLVLPSHHEGLGQVVLEAGAAGVPVVGAETGGIKSLLSNERGWLFQPKNVSAL